MTDEAFVASVERCEAPNEGFHHRDHLRLAWIYLHRYGRTEAAVRITETIRRFAAHHGQSGRYHETVTQAWLLLVDAAGGSSFEEALSAKPELLDQGLLRTYYSAGLLATEEAKTKFVPPDTAALPDAR